MRQGLEIARQRIEAEAETKTGYLDLGQLGLSRLPDELFELTHLQTLNLGSAGTVEGQRFSPQSDISSNFVRRDLDRLSTFANLRGLLLNGIFLEDLHFVKAVPDLTVLTCRDSGISDLSPVSCLKDLRSLDCSTSYSNTYYIYQRRHSLSRRGYFYPNVINDLAPLASLLHLRSLHCDSTKVSDPGPLAKLHSLCELSCRATRISDLTPIAELPNLEVLDWDSSNARNIGALANFRKLRKLSLGSVQASDLDSIANLANLETLSFFGSNVGALDFLENLSNLQILVIYLWNTGTDIDLNSLSNLRNLRKINIDQGRVSDLQPLSNLDKLEQLRVYSSRISNLEPLADLVGLKAIDLYDSPLSDLTPLSKLQYLERLSIGSSRVADLRPLRTLRQLRELDCSGTLVTDLSPLADIRNLEKIHFSGTPVSDLGPLKYMKNIREIWCDRTRISNLGPLSRLQNLKIFGCNDSPVSDLGPLKNHQNLQSLYCSETKVTDINPLSALPSLKHLSISNTQLRNLAPLAGLHNLQTLHLANTRIKDLNPISKLKSLRTLNFSDTEVTSIKPLENLYNLVQLRFNKTRISDLGPIEKLQGLQLLSCHETPITKLISLEGLRFLDCSGTNIQDLTPLAELRALQTLDIENTGVSDLGPLRGLPSLSTIRCGGTHVGNLSPLSGLPSLRNLSCARTSVSRLGPLFELRALQGLNCSDCVIQGNDHLSFWFSPSLETVIAENADISGLPYDVLSQSWGDNCLSAVRAHIEDLGEDPELLTDIKLIILGNGRIGKTQIANRLRGEDYEAVSDSTHGISITEAPIPGKDAQFNIWDFGGQDIYFGTHALFIKSRAVFMLVWTPDSDEAKTHEHEGKFFENRPVAWWVDFIRRFGNERSPLIAVQNQVDRDRPKGDHPAVAKVRDELSFCLSLAYSARTDQGRGALNDYLFQAADAFNPPLIGKGRLNILRTLQKWRETDRARAREGKPRQYRTISHKRFLDLCEETGQVSNPKQFLQFLNNAGQAFWREGLFDDQIILDQAWVLDAVYTIFDRDRCLPYLLAKKGEFTRSELGILTWDNEGYSKDEQELFLSFMQSCGLCFTLRSADQDREATYVAPDCLAETWNPTDRLERWGEEPADLALPYNYDALPDALMRNFIGRIGNEAGLSGAYWRSGFFVFEQNTRARLLVEQMMTTPLSGCITVSVRGGRSRDLLERIIKILREEERRLGVKPNNLEELSEAPSEEQTQPEGSESDRSHTGQFQLEFGSEPGKSRQYYISYAWADVRREHDLGEDPFVERFCARAEARGITIQRDKDVMRMGESIVEFAERIGRGDRVIVVLSDAYLRSIWCMRELHEIWNEARHKRERFVKRVRFFTHDDFDPSDADQCSMYAKYWRDQYEERRRLVRERGLETFGAVRLQEFVSMQKFAVNIGDILDIVYTTLQPGTIEELEAYTFDDDDFDD